MKKQIRLIVLSAILLILVIVSIYLRTSENSRNNSNNKVSNDVEYEASQENLSIQMEMVESYFLTGQNGTDYMQIIKNNSEYNVEVSSVSIAKDQAGKVIGIKEKDSFIDSGGSVCVWYNFSECEEIAEVEDIIYAKKFKEFQPCTHNIDADIQRDGNELNLTITNNGEITLEDIEIKLLFFKEGKMINFDILYDSFIFMSDDFQIFPKESVVAQLGEYDNEMLQYDDVKVYVTAAMVE